MDGNIMGIVGIFIAIVIMLAIGTQILGNTGFDCKGLEGYDSGGTPAGSASTGWAATCFEVSQQSQSGYNLLVIIIIVVAAVGILFVVRMLQ